MEDAIYVQYSSAVYALAAKIAVPAVNELDGIILDEAEFIAIVAVPPVLRIINLAPNNVADATGNVIIKVAVGATGYIS